VIFNDSMPWQAAHMVVAAYLVGGFLIASVYATGMLRGRRDRYHYLGFVIAFTVGAVTAPIQIGIGDGLARWVYNNQPVKFATIELVPTTSSVVPETLLGHLNSDGTVSGGIPIPGLASWQSDPRTGKATVVQGLDSVPPDQRPTIRQTNIVHLCWGHHGGTRHAPVPARGVVSAVLDLWTAPVAVLSGHSCTHIRNGTSAWSRFARSTFPDTSLGSSTQASAG
jgi:cytochrome bd-type quinol oxidase subunit 1